MKPTEESWFWATVYGFGILAAIMAVALGIITLFGIVIWYAVWLAEVLS